ncbi:MAG: hypothetical protein K2J83_03730, partial [Clostridia bacterium]|nr:hypothetical protein [Clostridia bacterium]
EAIFNVIDADMGNVVFKTGEGSCSATSERVSYTVPQSGAAAFIGNVRDFVTKTWLGLPIWAWLAIGLAVLILLIIIIAVACKRRKSKEERAEAKARKEEERQMQREKLEAERELAKAKQEAELEKIRAQAGFAGMGMAGAGMASMAMQQASPQPQPQQPMQMQQPVQQPQMQAQTVQQMPMQMPVQMPSQAAQPSGGMNVSEMMAMMFAQFAGMKADNADKEIAALKSDKEITALKTEIEIMKLKMEQLKDSKSVQSVDGKHELTPEFLGAVIASAMRSNGVLPQPAPVAELPQQTAENTSVNCEYPPDAVITTTTTVDTTQKQPARRNERGVKDEFMDVDGFYEEI